jgi:acetyl esterase/lipase
MACAAATLALAAFATAPAAPVHNVTFAELKARAKRKADLRLAYGDLPSQVVDLWLPGGAGPHPVVVMIHGGCWIQSVAGLDLMNFIADDLRRHGVAVWNIEYRRLGEPGAGYPGTFQDVGQAIDLLGKVAPKYGLKLDPLVAVGHSAGGHLALWAAARGRIAKDSPLFVAHPLKIDAVIGQGALGDLDHGEPGMVHACGAGTVAQLIGPASAGRPDVYADTSPDRMEPFPARQILFYGAVDDLAPASQGDIYRDDARKRGGKVEVSVIANANHFDQIAPETAAWAEIRTAILGQLRGGRMGGQAAAHTSSTAKPW